MVSIVGSTRMHLKRNFGNTDMGENFLFDIGEVVPVEKPKRVSTKGIKLVRRPLFSMNEERVKYLTNPLPNELLEDVQQAHVAHRVVELSERLCYESLLFCIASQGTSFEKATGFIKASHGADLELLTDAYLLQEQAKASGLLYHDRFADPLAYMKAKGIRNVVSALLNDPFNTREALSEVKFLKRKTISFWHLCLGGKELVTLDRHNNLQIHGLGVDMAQALYDPQMQRSDGKRVPSQPTPKEYVRIEKETLTKFEREDPFYSEGKLDGALVTTLFWTVGTLMARGQKLWEGREEFFYTGSRPKFVSPYSVK